MQMAFLSAERQKMVMSRIPNSESIACKPLQHRLLDKPLRLPLPATVLPAGILPRLPLPLPAKSADVMLPVKAAGLLPGFVRKEHATALGWGVPAPILPAVRCGCSPPLQ